MKILLYGINYSPELTGIGKYTGEMARWLVKQGHEVRVVTAPPYYPDWKVWSSFSNWTFTKVDEEGVMVFRSPLYVPRKPTAFKRLVHLFSFSFTSSFLMLAQVRWKPDLVMLIVPTLFCSPQAIGLAKLCGAKSIIHVQDFEVDALFGLGLASNGLLRRFAYAMERLTLQGFDRVSSISSAMLRRAHAKGVSEEKQIFFPNWSETSRFSDIQRSEVLLSRLGVCSDKQVLLYSGNIGEKQGLETVIEAADRLRGRTNLVFLIVGEGAGKARLQELARSKSLENVIFAPLQPYEDLPALLASADCHLVIQKRGAADAVLPSKLTNILAAGGNALITADPGTSLGDLCLEYPGIAVLSEPECVEALLDGIEQCLSMSLPNRVAIAYAASYLDKERILTRFINEV